MTAGHAGPGKDQSSSQMGDEAVTDGTAPPVANPGHTALDRLISALSDPDHLYTSQQVAWLMAAAARWARDDAHADGVALGVQQEKERQTALMLEALGSKTHVFSAEELTRVARIQRYRAACDQAGSEPRSGDFPAGGTVTPTPEWDFDLGSSGRGA